MVKVVALGGGHGLSASLRALRQFVDELTAVVTVADDGGSSGKLREEFDILPPGDLRMALAALCEDTTVGQAWVELLQTRFQGEGALAGHAVGNLMMTGLWQNMGSVQGLEVLGSLLGVKGRVLPMSAVPLEIEADVIGLDPFAPDELNTLTGQSTVAKAHTEVRNVRLLPERPPAVPEALAAVENADAIVVGPGSWFTSVIPHLLVPDLCESLVRSNGKRILVLNVVPALETAGFTAARHIELLADHAPQLRFDLVLADSSFVGDDIHISDYVASLGGRLIVADMAARDGSATHDIDALSAVLKKAILEDEDGSYPEA